MPDIKSISYYHSCWVLYIYMLGIEMSYAKLLLPSGVCHSGSALMPPYRVVLIIPCVHSNIWHVAGFLVFAMIFLILIILLFHYNIFGIDSLVYRKCSHTPCYPFIFSVILNGVKSNTPYFW